jgi:NAD-dependent deacetylase
MGADDARLDAVAQAVRDARRVLFITGAGLSADSGLPTYRGVGGLYDDRDTDAGMPIEVALSGRVFRERPDLTWRHIRDIEAAGRGAQPNTGHRFMATLQAHADVWVLTQNVDGLHRAAGSRQVIAIHGGLHDLSCTRCAWTDRVPDYRQLETVPVCPDCGAVVRPDIVLFGEMLPPAAVAALERELTAGFDVVFSVGTSSLFPYITAPVRMLGERGATTVEINPGQTAVSDRVTHRLQMGAADALGRLAERLYGAAISPESG